MYTWVKYINSVVISDRERDVEVWKNDKVYFKWGRSKSPFNINSVVFHFDDFNYGRRSQPHSFVTIATQLFFVFITYNKMKKIYHTVGTVPAFNRKIVEICKFAIPIKFVLIIFI
jgi:hypothetical protein